MLVALLAFGVGIQGWAQEVDRLGEFKKRAGKFGGVIAVPELESTTNAIQASVERTMAAATTALNRIAALDAGKVTFENTILALDDLSYQINLTDNRQIAFGLADLTLHTQIHDANAKEVLPLSNQVLGEAHGPPETAMVAYFGHLMHYDAGHYGYAWADAIAADLATVFEKSPVRNSGTRRRGRSRLGGAARH